MIWLSLAMATPKLAAVYDATAAAQLIVPEGETLPGSLAWHPSDGMTTSCGPAKSPDGIGVFEAEAVGQGMTPTLTILVEDAGHLGPDQVRVSLGQDQPQVLLQPMIVPRHLEILVRGDPGTERVAQLVRTQLETETCMEHKTGRGWTGHDADRVRQAFLLDPPMGTDRSRKFFGGQTDPVPALTGPPDACLRMEGPVLPRGNQEGRGEGSLTLVPTDVWGASLRACAESETGGAAVMDASARLPLGERVRPTWSRLSVGLNLAPGAGTDEERARVSLSLDGIPLKRQEPLFVVSEGVLGMVDLLAAVPNTYPHVDDTMVLMVPDWQLVEALRRLERGKPDEPLHTSNAELADGVNTVLSRPELLFVQIAPESGNQTSWANLAGVMRSTVRQPWGYTVGTLHGRAPIVLPAMKSATWDQSMRAQRGDVHAALLAAVLVLFVAFVLGLRRLQDLVNPRPEERAHYWPGLESANIHDNMTNNPVEEEAE